MKDLDNVENNTKNCDWISELSKKKDVNLQSHSTLYFQIGLILCLLGTYALFEMNFQTTIRDYVMREPITDPDVFYMPEPKPVPEEKVEKRQPQPKVAVLTDKPPVVKKNNDPLEPIKIKMPEVAATNPPKHPVVNDPVEPTPKTNKPFSMIDVERVPIFPGCESASNNAERMACMSEKLTKLIQKKFNTDLAAELGLKGIQRIQVEFMIDNTGHVTNIKTRSPYSKLEKEAERVVGKIPVMTPGMQRNEPVSVVYNLPIAFQVL